MSAAALQVAAVLGELPHPSLPQISKSAGTNNKKKRGKLIVLPAVVLISMVLPTAVLFSAEPVYQYIY